MGGAELDCALGAVMLSDAGAELGEVVVDVDDFALCGVAGRGVERASLEGDPPTATIVAEANLIPLHSMLHSRLHFIPECRPQVARCP